MRRRSIGELLRDPAWLWVAGIGIGSFVVFYLILGTENGAASWGRPVLLAMGFCFTLFAAVNLYRKE